MYTKCLGEIVMSSYESQEGKHSPVILILFNLIIVIVEALTFHVYCWNSANALRLINLS